MSKREKLIEKLLGKPKDFTFDELTTLYYKGFIGNIEYSQEDNTYHGRILGLVASISYEGQSVKVLKEDFEDSVEGYLDFCAKKNIQPEKSVMIV